MSGLKVLSNRIRPHTHTLHTHTPSQLSDPKRPDLIGLKPSMVKKLQRKQAFLKAVGASRAAAANDVLTLRRRRKQGEPAQESAGAALGSGWGDLGAMLDDNEAAGGTLPRPKSAQAQGVPTRITSNSAKKVVATKEVARLNLVAQHPAFVADPHAALREHLKATLGQQRQQQQQQQQQAAAAGAVRDAGQQRVGVKTGRRGR